MMRRLACEDTRNFLTTLRNKSTSRESKRLGWRTLSSSEVSISLAIGWMTFRFRSPIVETCQVSQVRNQLVEAPDSRQRYFQLKISKRKFSSISKHLIIRPRVKSFKNFMTISGANYIRASQVKKTRMLPSRQSFNRFKVHLWAHPWLEWARIARQLLK